MRTWIDYPTEVGVPRDHWKSNPFLIWPFAAFVPETSLGLPSREQTSRKGHPIFLAICWRELLDSSPALTTREIADDQGISTSRVRQILRLSTLAPGIISELQSMSSKQLKRFGETRLRHLVPLSPGDQIRKFNDL